MPRTAALVTHYNRPHLVADAAMSGDMESMGRACHVGKLINTTSVELIRRIYT